MIDYPFHNENDAGERRPGFALGRNKGRAWGGSKPSSSTTTTQKTELAPEIQPYVSPYMEHASAVAMRPYESYGGERIAGFNSDQNTGFDLARQTANTSNHMLGGANAQLDSTIAGEYLNRAMANNSYLGKEATVGTNALLGLDNPYLNQAINASMGDITKQFNNSVANNTDATMARSGAFGGSAWQQAQNQNVDTYTQNLGRTSNDMRMADYSLQAQLQEADVARRLQAQQTDLARNSGLAESGLNRNEAAYQAERARQMQGIGMVPGLAQAGYANSAAMLGIGDAIQGQTQAGLDVAYNDWLAQQNYPLQQLNVMGNALSTGMGAGGQQTVTAPNQTARNGTASALGGAMAGMSGAGMLGASMTGAGMAGPWGLAAGAGLGLLGGIM